MWQTEGEYRRPDESVEMPKQISVEFSSRELQPADSRSVDEQAASSSGVKRGGQQRPMMGRVTSTLESSARPRRHHFSPTGQCYWFLMSCSRLSWLLIRFWAYVIYLCIVSYHISRCLIPAMQYTVKPLMLACPLFREFRNPNKPAKLKGANINCRPVFWIVWL